MLTGQDEHRGVVPLDLGQEVGIGPGLDSSPEALDSAVRAAPVDDRLHEARREPVAGGEVDDPEAAIVQKLESDPYYSGDQVQMLLQKVLLTLPEKQRMVFNLKYYQEMKYEEMSEIFGTSVGALKASYHHAVKKIEKFLEEVD